MLRPVSRIPIARRVNLGVSSQRENVVPWQALKQSEPNNKKLKAILKEMTGNKFHRSKVNMDFTKINEEGIVEGQGFLPPTKEAHGPDDQCFPVRQFYDRCVNEMVPSWPSNRLANGLNSMVTNERDCIVNETETREDFGEPSGLILYIWERTLKRAKTWVRKTWTFL